MASNVAAVLVGAAVTFAVVRASLPRSDEQPRPEHAPVAAAPDLPAPPERFAFAPPGALRPTIQPSDEQTWTSTVAPADEEETIWSTETMPVATPPAPMRQSLLPSFRLPWQSQRPAPPPRTYTLKTRLAEISLPATARLAAKFQAVNANWPPSEIALVAIKDQKALELHARTAGGPWQLIHRYRVLAASGGAGPKLRQGDKQVPEGIYRISLLNPNSAYHVSMRVNYPNTFDRQMAVRDGRRDLGGDIMIHGKNLSAGCLAVGDEAVEELFVLAAQIGLANIRLIIAPTDFRQNGVVIGDKGGPDWLPQLYAEIASAMGEFKAPPAPSLLSFFANFTK